MPGPKPRSASTASYVSLWLTLIVLGVRCTTRWRLPSAFRLAHTLKAQHVSGAWLILLLLAPRLKGPSASALGNMGMAPKGKYRVRDRLRASTSNTSPGQQKRKRAVPLGEQYRHRMCRLRQMQSMPATRVWSQCVQPGPAVACWSHQEYPTCPFTCLQTLSHLV